jgi:hypothetical protein
MKMEKKKLDNINVFFIAVKHNFALIINKYQYSALWAGFGRNQSPVRRPVWLWHGAFWASS